jgi:hypothetical protein
MKKLISIVVIIFAIIATTTQMFAQQYSVRRIVRAEFAAGTLSVDNTTICPNMPEQIITGTPATGGLPSPAILYQWQISTDLSPAWVNIITGTNIDLATGSLAAGDYNYRRIDTNPGCGSTDTTNTISIHVWDVFTAGTATGGGDLCYSDPVTPITCDPATGGDPSTITQEVQTSPDGVTWTNTGNMTLSYTPVGPMIDDLYVRWEFISNCGTDYSNTIVYNVYDPFVAGTASTTTVSPICNGTDGGTATANAATGGAPSTTMEWEISTNGITYNNTGNMTLDYSFGALTVPTWIRMRYMNTCDTLYSNVLFVDVYTALANGGPSTLIGDDTICFNLDPGSIDAPVATDGSGTYTYQWIGNFNSSPFTNITGATSEDYDIPTLTTAGTYQYLRIASDNCGSVWGDTITVFMYEEFNAGIIGDHDESCSGSDQAPIIELTPASGGSGSYTYQWTLSTDNEVSFNPIAGENGINYTPPPITTPVELYYFYRREVTDAMCGTETSTAPALP